MFCKAICIKIALFYVNKNLQTTVCLVTAVVV